MTGTLFAERLAAAGLPDDEIAAKTRMCDDVLASFRSLTGAEPSYVSWVPGRLELFGKHTDYAGGRSIVAAVPRGFIFVAGAAAGADIHVEDAKNRERVTISTAMTPPPGGWRHYVAVVVARLARNFPGARSGATIAFASDLPRASGMSSSSALVVGVSAALTELWALRSREEWRREIRAPEDVATYYASAENGATFGRLSGDGGVGTHGGSEDHAAMLLARAGSVSAFSFVPMRAVGVVPLPPPWTVVIAASGVKAEKTGSAREAYNRLSEGTRRLTGLWNAHEQPCRSLAEALGTSPAAIDRLRELIPTSRITAWPHDAIRRRLDHFHAEDLRVPLALDAVVRSDTQTLGALAEASQRDAEELLGNQIPETTALAAEARNCGALAACSFGAGFGGSVWAIVDAERASEFVEAWPAGYRQRYPGGAPVAFKGNPGPPLTAVFSHADG
jgi:galactokinase